MGGLNLELVHRTVWEGGVSRESHPTQSRKLKLLLLKCVENYILSPAPELNMNIGARLCAGHYCFGLVVTCALRNSLGALFT